jgi:transcriptional regulator with XRE-family HTH domain
LQPLSVIDQNTGMNSEKIKTRLNRMLRLTGISEAELARRAKMNQPTVHRIMAGDSSDPRLSNLITLANAMGYTLDDLITEHSQLDGTTIRETGKPYTHKNPNEVPNYTIKQLNRGETTTATAICPFPHGPNTYAFNVDGMPGSPTPMHPSYGRAYPIGSVVFVDPDKVDEIENGDPVAAILTDDNVFCFRMLYRDGGSELLMPLNPQFPHVDRPYKIVGKVIGAILP